MISRYLLSNARGTHVRLVGLLPIAGAKPRTVAGCSITTSRRFGADHIPIGFLHTHSSIAFPAFTPQTPEPPIYRHNSPLRVLRRTAAVKVLPLKPRTFHTFAVAMAPSTVRNPRTSDPATQANTRDFVTKSSKLDYEVSFEKKNIEGFVEHELEAISGEEEGVVRDEIWLDTSHLDIGEISIGEEALEQATDLEAAEKGWKVAERVEPYGSKLIVKLGRVADKGEVIVLKVDITTTWLKGTLLFSCAKYLSFGP